ncbi:AAA domain-containing protein [Pseudopedobacter beijingensis]|uniref:AAA domain-containing protein n=1 Tax=Pseudopedobacter beijingensis TaxID=1207056 RepID=A0ABW4IGZ9_9SPHI
MSYFSELLRLLDIEKKEDQSLFEQQSISLSILEKKEAGLTWYPIAIKNTELGRGDYLSVEVERKTNTNLEHQFKFGVPVLLYSNYTVPKESISGVVSHVSGNIMKITFKTDELPDWADKGKLGVEVLFDNNSYDEMEHALKTAHKRIVKNEDASLIEVLQGTKDPGKSESICEYKNNRLNESQNKAVQHILEANDLSILHGPPGTGKTTTLTHAIIALKNQVNGQILVCAPSNTAVDLLSMKLAEQGVNVVRIGNPVRVSSKLIGLTLEAKTSSHNYYKDIKSLKKRAAEYKNMAHKYKRNFGKLEREQRKALFDEAYKILKEVEQTESFITKDVLDKAEVITATLVGSNHFSVRDRKYAVVVIDEAGQALEPACWIPILKTSKLIMAGDHLQLPPTIKSKQAENEGMGDTLLEKCALKYPSQVSLLTTQYRMNEAIMGYSSMVFYGGNLKADPSVAQETVFPSDLPLEFIDTAGCSFEEKMNGTSIFNPDEATFLINHLKEYLENLTVKPSVAIIAPYKQQTEQIKSIVEMDDFFKQFSPYLDVNTVDSFQGQERDVVYISLTRSNNQGQIGFLSDIRRMNVAITRAKKKLVIIGDSSTLSKNEFYNNFMAYIEKEGSYKSAWEFIHA